MIQLSNKKILLCITGGIAAYKTPELTRIFKKNRADVRIIMTESAKEFVASLSLQAVSGNQIHYSLLDEEAELGMSHIELAKWADVILIAPCTAESIARLAQGRANDLMSAVILASDAELFIAPAMNTKMWQDKVTQMNVDTLKIKNINFIGPDSGEQACGDIGEGRMSEPYDIASAIADSFSSSSLNGKRILITAGPTVEPIDPVRYLTNNSSGKMGYALAEIAYLAGAEVYLISGPVNLKSFEGVNLININTADEMLLEVKNLINKIDIFIGCAAVADFKPIDFNTSKIKKNEDDEISLKLTKNPDILEYASDHMKDKIVIGFSAETDNVIENAKIKLLKKNLNMIICNDVSDKTIGFDSNDNEVHLITHDDVIKLSKTTKLKIAKQIIKSIESLISK
ncbi:bifunctional phosphopantothenoylcysteine decarboxylase/phosphopantothenate--cysteine ligase CoaBC [Gammaproteobacteria bacterium]|nr:bifunctional phosphopantothenoylcysteine decarboxylase/phosphopantothenate--cysteine ligase CoaBC [Gammaproteobacteria bacterium]|tara:strand:- start:9778 stop:10977 length:1200 start_codon:yes stop_codon:yes gene_type:complete